MTAIIDGTAAENGTNVLGAAQGLGGIARLDLVSTQGGGCRAVLQSAVTAEAMESSRSTWLEMAAAQAQTDTAADTADPGKDTAAAGGKDTAAPTETADAARQAGADAYVYAAAKIAALDADDQSILYTPLFTYAENPDASRTISFGNYLAALYAEAVANDTASGLPEGAAVEALAGAARHGAHPACQHPRRCRQDTGGQRQREPRLPEQPDRVHAGRGHRLHRYRHGHAGSAERGLHRPAGLRRCILGGADEYQ